MITVQALTDKSRQAADLMALTGAIPAGVSFAAAEGTQLDDLAAVPLDLERDQRRGAGSAVRAARGHGGGQYGRNGYRASGRNEGGSPAGYGRHPNDLKQE